MLETIPLHDQFIPCLTLPADIHIHPFTNPTIHLPITHIPTRLDRAQPSSAYSTHTLSANASEISAFICWRCFVCQCHGSSCLPFATPVFAPTYAYGDADGTGSYTRWWREAPIWPTSVVGCRALLGWRMRREVLRLSIRARETRKEMKVKGAIRSCHGMSALEYSF